MTTNVNKNPFGTVLFKIKSVVGKKKSRRSGTLTKNQFKP